MRFSIITPSFNQGGYIAETIESVLAQGYPDFEHIVVDGGSTDSTVEVLKRYPHLKWVSEPDQGQSDAVCKGIQLATGDVIGWINSDDFYYPGTFQKAAAFLQAHPETGIVSGDYTFVDQAGRVLRTRREVPFDKEVYLYARKCYLANCAMFFRADLLREHGGPRASLRYSMDYELELRLSYFARYAHVSEVWGCYRLHAASKTVADNGADRGENSAVQLEYLRKEPGRAGLKALSSGDKIRGRLAMARRIWRKALAGCYFPLPGNPSKKTA